MLHRRRGFGAMSLETSVLRQVLRLARDADRCPARMVPLLGRPPRIYSPQVKRIVRAPVTKWRFVEDAISEAIGGSLEYALPLKVGPQTSVASAVRRHRRRAQLLGLGTYREEALVLCRRLKEASDGAKDAQHALDSSGAGQEPQSKVGFTLEPVDVRDTTPAQVGDFLIAHPLACIFQPALDQAVILVDHVDEQAATVRGTVLNMPSHASVQELVAAWPDNDPHDLWETTEDLQPILHALLWRGGDLSGGKGPKEDVRWLHIFDDGAVPGAREVAPDVWLGGDVPLLAAQVVKARKACCADTSFEHFDTAWVARPIIGHCAWSRSQLALELERGVWVRARATSVEAAHGLCFPESPPPTKKSENGQVPSDLHKRLSNDQTFRAAHWRSALRAVGAHVLAAFPRGPGADVKLKALLNSHFRRRAEETEHGRFREGNT